MEYDGNEKHKAPDARQPAEQRSHAQEINGSVVPVPAVLSYLGLGKTAFTSGMQEEQLISALTHTDWSMRVAAVRKLGRMGEHAPVKALVAALEDENEAVRTAAVRTLGKLGPQAPIAPIVAALDDTAWTVRAAAVVALGKQSKRTPVAPLLAALEDKDEAVRASAAWALGTLEERTPIAPLVVALRDSASTVREAAALALGELKERMPLGPLLVAKADEDIEVKQTVERVLQQTHPELFTAQDESKDTDTLLLDLIALEQIASISYQQEQSGTDEHAVLDVGVEKITQNGQHSVEQEARELEQESDTYAREVYMLLTSRGANAEKTVRRLHSVSKRKQRTASVRGQRLMSLLSVSLVALLLLSFGLTLLVLNQQHHPSYTIPAARPYLNYPGHGKEVYAIAWSPESATADAGGTPLIASVGADGTVQIWDASTGVLFRSQDLHFSKMLAMRWSTSSLVIAYVSLDGIVMIRNLTPILQGQPAGNPIALQTAKNVSPVAAFSPDGKHLAVAFNGGKSDVAVVDSATGRQLYIIHAYTGDTTHKSYDGDVTAIAWSPQGTRIVTAGDDETQTEKPIQVWDASNGQQILHSGFDTSTEEFKIVALAWSPDNVHLGLATLDGSVHLRNSSEGNNLLNLDAGTSATIALAWSPNSKSLASTTATGLVQVWDVVSGNLLYTYNGHSKQVDSMAWSPDGQHIASASVDGTVQVWGKP